MAAASAVTSSPIGRAWARFDGPGRLVGIDLARGLAVLGMLAAHLLDTERRLTIDPETWVTLVNGRSSILFATLAGVSIALVTGGPRPLAPERRPRAAARLALRGALLWVIGMLLVATGVPVYVILPAYALLFVLALPFLGMRPRGLFATAGALALVMPWLQPVLDAAPLWAGRAGAEIDAALGWHYPFTVWIAYLLAGMGVGRLDLRRVEVQGALVMAGGALMLFGYGAALFTAPVAAGNRYLAAVLTAEDHSQGLWEVIGSGGFALVVIGVCLLLCRTPLRWPAVPLRAVGSMPLTAYVLQLVVWAIVALALLGDTGDLFGIREAGLFVPLTVGLVIGCTAWALTLGRGPLEWVIDAVVRLVVGRDRDADSPAPGSGGVGGPR
ncbi:putative membrane protein YeiB [Microbacterium sp. SORGH_AS 1204]|uniref:heparan-alpha-glucosaminide N-acetyltransferase domain-containing protein n=1 Tax=Microbacterium sp. SORGH_AS_1204 TaxID=3041785 RepID=UPI00278F5C24|nr:heparan-alpha-glucosaminide N-acetyltransferase domain-containing protein [Microbacterium sp. SORGH_AS_1204]MDQ1137323.1 putative membrane protein YeiB [Microbacterium sp. SORGH_AS_1204]